MNMSLGVARGGQGIGIAICVLMAAIWNSPPGRGQGAMPHMLESGAYPDVATARATWTPMPGSAPVDLGEAKGQAALRLRCTFAGTTIERASWERIVDWDLVSCRGVQFQIFCQDATPISYFSLYFQSGEGWYHAMFYPESSTGWNTVVVDKSEVTVEGKPLGWHKISRVRLSAWRGKDVDTDFHLRDLRPVGVLGRDASVAVIRAASVTATTPAESRSVDRYTEAVVAKLRAGDVGAAVLNDTEVTLERLRPAKVVVLPYNPSLPDSTTRALQLYLAQGGKLLGFYLLPEALRRSAKLGEVQYVKASRPGEFSAIRFTDGALPGVPAVVKQNSGNINVFQPVAGASRVLAEWLDDQGRTTGRPAVVGSSNCVMMSHVLLPEDGEAKGRMLLAMVGALAPEVWKGAVEAGLGRIGEIGGFASFDEAVRGIPQAGPRGGLVKRALEQAGQLRSGARAALAQGEFAKATEAAAAAQAQVEAAFCLAQKPQGEEFRAFWCHSAFGVSGMNWDEAVRRLAENGFTAILPNMLWAGAAYCPSDTLPVAAEAAKRGDQIAECLAACRKYGIQIHVWKVNWNLGHAVPQEFVEKMRQAHRLQANAEGKEEPWLCPSHPDNRELEIASMVEVARKYDVDGIHFDYIRYPDAEHCYCAGCKERFAHAKSVTITAWPGDVLKRGPHHALWLDWRRDNITAVVRGVSELARAVRPKLRISAAVFPVWNIDRDNIGQDWKLWCERGYLDFVCPMDYTTSNRRFENLVSQQVQWAGRVPCYPGIGVSASSSKFGVDKVIEQIGIARQYQTKGFVIFNYGVPESRELLPKLGLGITAKE